MDLIKSNDLPSKKPEDLINIYLQDIGSDLQGMESEDTYRRTLQQFGGFLEIEEVTIGDLVKSDVVKYREYLKTKVDERTGKLLSPFTVNNYVSAVKRFLNWLEVETGGQFFNVAKNVKTIKIAKGYTKSPLNTAQTKLIYQHLQEQIDKAERDSRRELTALRNMLLYDLLLKTGMRTMSAVNVTMKDIQKEGDRYIIYFKQKGKAGKAVAILEPNTVKRIHSYLEVRENKEADDFLFVSHSNRSSGKGLTTKSVRREIRSIFDDCGLLKNLDGQRSMHKLTAHSLRHTFATETAKEKGIYITQMELGHTSSDTTMLYTKMIQQQKRFRDRIDYDKLFEG
ncbi:MAG: integrase/recombinase XerD [Flavobacteriales bacterium]|jgi:integrase/recombinase XerD